MSGVGRDCSSALGVSYREPTTKKGTENQALMCLALVRKGGLALSHSSRRLE
jgi:hypothetical protein